MNRLVRIPPPRFQFALPRGERPARSSPPTILPIGFNSRSRVGSDSNRCPILQRERVSIRAPAWGATPLSDAGEPRPAVSIRAPAWGATPEQQHVARLDEVSIRAPAWGATNSVEVFRVLSFVSIRAPAWGATHLKVPASSLPAFQFALPRGERLLCVAVCTQIVSFNSRSRVGSDRRQ